MAPGVAEIAVVAALLVALGFLFVWAFVDAFFLGPRREGRRRALWAQVATRLGMRLTDQGASFFALEGIVEGVMVVTRVERIGRGRRSPARTAVRAWFSPPLDLGLAVGVATGLAGLAGDGLLADLFGGPAIRLGRGDVDDRLAVRGDEEARVRSLFAPEQQDAVAALLAMTGQVCIVDAGMAAFHPRVCTDPAWLEAATRAVARLARLLLGAAARVPAATPLTAHRETWRTFAGGRGLQFTETPFGLRGVLDGMPVAASAVRRGRGEYILEVLVPFPRPVPRPFIVSPRASMDWLTMLFEPLIDVTGDASFDQSFLVRSNPLGWVPKLLGPEARAALIELHGKGLEVLVRPDGVVVRAPVGTDPAVLPLAVLDLRRVVEPIARNAAALAGT